MVRSFAISLIFVTFLTSPAFAYCALKSGEKRKEGIIVYNKKFEVLQVCLNTKWKALGRIKPVEKPACNESNLMPGCLRADGTVYAGLSPDGDRPMFVRRCDYGQNWNGLRCDGLRLARPFGDGFRTYLPIQAISLFSGAHNTATLMTMDANGEEDGVQPFLAAKACADMVADGHSDWYLPAPDELSMIYHHRMEIENIHPTGQYWSSQQNGVHAGTTLNVGSGRIEVRYIDAIIYIRCTRKN